MNIQIRIWRFNLALSIYALDYRTDVRMLAHAHIGWQPTQYGFVWFQPNDPEMRAAFGRKFQWLYPRQVKK